jgi:hypothetical protein
MVNAPDAEEKGPGTNVMILKIFWPKKMDIKLAFWTKNNANLCQKLIVTDFT